MCVKRLKYARYPWIFALELDDDGAIVRKTYLDMDSIHQDESSHFMVRLHMEIIRMGNKRKSIGGTNASGDAKKGKVLLSTMKNKLSLISPHEKYDAAIFSGTPSAVLTEALEKYCRIYACPFQTLTKTIDFDGVFLMKKVFSGHRSTP